MRQLNVAIADDNERILEVLSDLIEKDKDQNTKAKRIYGKRPRLLWLRVDALEEKEEYSDGE